jgi:hypothetical protein
MFFKGGYVFYKGNMEIMRITRLSNDGEKITCKYEAYGKLYEEEYDQFDLMPLTEEDLQRNGLDQNT